MESILVQITDGPILTNPATPQGMALLKIIAWTDRGPGNRKKDAEDLCYLLGTYEKIPAITDTASMLAAAREARE